ncbi:tetratricopeptide repeat protein [bacterium]|nr:tetratricopeptide repeat protein [bacterium]
MRASLRTVLLACLAVTACFALVFAVYRPALDAQLLTWDDNDLVTRNYRLRYLSRDTLIDMFRLKPLYGRPAFALYVPLTVLSVAAEYRLFGADPFVYHFTNVLLHGLNAVLVCAFLRLLSGRVRVAVIGAVFFAVHPLHVESVAWVTERKDVLSAFFYLAALLLYLRWRRAGSAAAYALAAASGVCAVLAKPVAVTLPVSLVLIDLLERRGFTWSTVLDKAPFVCAAIFGACATVYTQGAHGALDRQDTLNVLGNLFVSFRGLLFYAVKTFAPTGLMPVYPRPSLIDTGDPVTIASVLVTAGLVVAVVACRRRAPLVSFGLAFFLVAVSLNLQILPSGLQVVAADRFYYLPSVGVALVLGAALDWMFMRPYARAVAAAACMVAFALWSWTTWSYAGVWRTNESLWSYTLARSPDSPIAKGNLALAYILAGRQEEALRLQTEMLRSDTNAVTIANLAIGYLKLGNVSQAWSYVQLAFSNGLARSETYYAAAFIDASRGRHEDAIRHLEHVIAGQPLRAEAHLHMGVEQLALQRTNDAIASFARFVELEPGERWAALTLARLFESSGELGNACGLYGAIFKREPGAWYARHREGLMHLRLRDFPAARDAFHDVSRAVPDNATAWSDLAVAHRELGNQPEAIRCSRKALSLYAASPKILYDHACIMAMAGAVDEALTALTNAVARSEQLRLQAMTDPDLVSLRALPAFRECVGR